MTPFLIKEKFESPFTFLTLLILWLIPLIFFIPKVNGYSWMLGWHILEPNEHKINIAIFFYYLSIAFVGYVTNKFYNYKFSASIFSALLFLLFLNLKTKELMGDSNFWIDLATKPGTVWLSEPYANLIHKFAYSIFGIMGMNMVSPIFASLSAFIFLNILNEINSKANILWAELAYLASPLPFFGSYGWIENTFLSTPFNLLSLFFLVKYFKYNCTWKYLIYSVIFLSLAILIHGENLCLLPAPFLAVLITEGRSNHSSKKFVLKVIVSLSLPFAII